VRGKVVLKIFGTISTAMRATLLEAIRRCAGRRRDRPRPLPRQHRAAAPDPLDRPALARAGIDVAEAQDVVETALSGRSSPRCGNSERSCPCGSASRSPSARTRHGSAQCRVPAADGARMPLPRARAIETGPAGDRSTARQQPLRWRSSSTSRGATWLGRPRGDGGRRGARRPCPRDTSSSGAASSRTSSARWRGSPSSCRCRSSSCSRCSTALGSLAQRARGPRDRAVRADRRALRAARHRHSPLGQRGGRASSPCSARSLLVVSAVDERRSER
jgi:hypothetical protein